MSAEVEGKTKLAFTGLDARGRKQHWEWLCVGPYSSSLPIPNPTSEALRKPGDHQ
jgi:cell division protein FtsN